MVDSGRSGPGERETLRKPRDNNFKRNGKVNGEL